MSLRHDLAGGPRPSVYGRTRSSSKWSYLTKKKRLQTIPAQTNKFMAKKGVEWLVKKNFHRALVWFFGLGSSQTFPVCQWSFNASYNCSGSNFATNQMTKEQTWTPYKHRFSIWFIPNKIQLLGRYPISQFEVPRHPHRLRWKSVQFPPGPVEELC